MPLSLIAAVANNHVIGKNNRMIWHMPNDLKFFKETTIGHHVIMGRKNYEAEGKPLPKRTNIIITRQKDYRAAGCIVVHSLDAALELAKDDDEPFIIGGAEIYKLALPLLTKMYITRIYGDFEGDTFFPEIDYSQWKKIMEDPHDADERNPYPYTFFIYMRKD